MLQRQPKYSLDNCLPAMFHQARTRDETSTDMIVMSPYPVQTRGHSSRYAVPVPVRGTSRPEQAPKTIRIDAQATAQMISHSGPPPKANTKTSKPLVAKIGAAGRRIADVVRHVGHSKGQLSNSGSSCRSNTTCASSRSGK